MTGPVVVALGGNALAAGPGAVDPDDQLRQLEAAVAAIAPLADDHDLVVTHGNGPQVGVLADRAAAAGSPVALDVLDAQSEGLIGYSLVLALDNALAGREVVALLTRTRVDRNDPAFDRPTKPIGLPDARGDRRLVASPEPLEIFERESIARLVAAGVVVVCVGGGGIPVARAADGSLGGVEAVVDKDLASGLVATDLGAEELLLLTDVDGVYEGWGTDAARRIDRTTPAALRAGGFAAGSMGPKAEAAARFVERGGGRAAIGALGDAAALLAGTAGTQVDAGPDDPRGGEATA